MTGTGGIEFRAEVFIALKRLVNDPEGIEIRNGLHNLGYPEVSDVRSGKYFQVRLKAASESEARERMVEMCERLLCNTVIEEYRVAIHELAASS